MSAALTYEESEPLMAQERPSMSQLAALRRIILTTKMQGARKLQRLTQKDVADELGWQRYNVSDLEKGRSSIIMSLWAYGDAVRTPLSVLIQQTDMEVEDLISRGMWRQVLEANAPEEL